MQIISHRGLWSGTPGYAKNSLAALKASLDVGFGLETDLRDFDSRIVLSHDMASSQSVRFEDFLEVYAAHPFKGTLALNIKADGLQTELARILKLYSITNYFVFDASVPDAIQYLNGEFIVFTRQSEYEMTPSFYDLSYGVWLDEFFSPWIDEEVVVNHLSNGKFVAVVSPELHGRSYSESWVTFRNIHRSLNLPDIILCTDFPKEANRFFNEYY